MSFKHRTGEEREQQSLLPTSNTDLILDSQDKQLQVRS